MVFSRLLVAAKPLVGVDDLSAMFFYRSKKIPLCLGFKNLALGHP